MKLYIKAISSYRSDLENIVIKKELKELYKLDTRRQEAFVHLGILGAQRLKKNIELKIDDELYITSGAGNIDILQKTHAYVCEENNPISPYDFLNMLGNSMSYYVGKSLGVQGKNIFQISNNFTIINSLISIYASLSLSKKDAILGAVDLATQPQELTLRALGMDNDSELLSSVNYQKLSISSTDAIAEITFDSLFYTLDEIEKILETNSVIVSISNRCDTLEVSKESKFFQTQLSYSINQSINNKKDMLYIDCSDNKYKILRLKTLN